jgi:hypothetical protein
LFQFVQASSGEDVHIDLAVGIAIGFIIAYIMMATAGSLEQLP